MKRHLKKEISKEEHMSRKKWWVIVLVAFITVFVISGSTIAEK